MYKVYDIGESVEIRNELLEEHIQNLDNIFERIIQNDIDNEQYVIYQLENNDNINEHLLYKINRDILNGLERERTVETYCSNLAEKLLEAEQIKENDIVRRNKSITKGILIIKIETSSFTLMKLEETSAVDKNTFEFIDSFSIDRQYYKACKVNKNDLENIVILDRNKKVAKYWAGKFLELVRKKSSYTNTENLMKYLEKREVLAEIPGMSDIEKENYNKKIEDYLSKQSTFEKETLFNELEFDGKPEIDVTNFLNNNLFPEIDEEFQIDKAVVKKHFKDNIRVTANTVIKSDNLRKEIRSNTVEYDIDRRALVIRIDEEYNQKVSEKFDELDY